jgi:hypothetical protein
MILGLSPLSRYDFGATPITDCFEAPAQNSAAFTAVEVGPAH